MVGSHGASGIGLGVSGMHNLLNPTKVNFAKKTSNKSGKEKGSDTPNWAKGKKPNTGEKPSDFAKRLMDEKAGRGNWKEGAKSEYNKLKKYAERLIK